MRMTKPKHMLREDLTQAVLGGYHIINGTAYRSGSAHSRGLYEDQAALEHMHITSMYHGEFRRHDSKASSNLREYEDGLTFVVANGMQRLNCTGISRHKEARWCLTPCEIWRSLAYLSRPSVDSGPNSSFGEHRICV